MTALARSIGIRLGQAIGLLLAVVVIVFLLVQLAPGDAALYLAGEQGVGDPEFLAKIRADYGLDQPLLVQLGTYIGNVAQLDLGESTYFGEPVLGLILDRLLATVALAGAALLFAVIIGVALGVFTARRPESPASHGVTVMSLVGFATPVFWLSLMFIVVFAAKWGVLPVGGIEDVRYEGGWFGETVDFFQHLVLPAVSLGIIYLAIYS
nr:ABC transporter permease [Acidimicrobiales bacterium]